MTQADLATIAIAVALTATVLTVALSASWRSLKRWWATTTWTPRLTPGIKADVFLTMGEDGHVNVLFEKFRPEDNVSEVYAKITEQWFAAGESLGVNMHWSSKIGAVIETPEGKEYVVALVRATQPKVRTMSDAEERVGESAQ